MAHETILVDTEDGVGIVTLNRPDVLNAMNRALSRELHDAVKAFEADDAIGCIVITGSGEKAFSAGGDIHEQRSDDARYSQAELDAMRNPRSSYDISACAKPMIGMMNGLAYGGAAVLASSLDMRIGCEATKFRFLAAAYGRINSTWTLPNQVGWPMAKELLFSARIVEAEEAYRIGLLNHLVPRARLRDEDHGVGAHDRRQPPRRGDGGQGAAAAAEGQEPGRAVGGGAGLHHACDARREGGGRVPRVHRETRKVPGVGKHTPQWAGSAGRPGPPRAEPSRVTNWLMQPVVN